MNERDLAKKAKEILKRPYSRVLTPEQEGGFSAEMLEFRGCFSQGDTPGEAVRNLEKAATNWVKAMLAQGSPIPEPFEDEGFSGRIALRLPKSLHAQASKLASKDGVSLNQFLVDAVARHVGEKGALQGATLQSSQFRHRMRNQ